MKTFLFLVVVVSMGFTMHVPEPPVKKVADTSCEAYNLDFLLVNKTGYDISEIYVSPTKMKDWGEDIMGRDILASGESVEISFDTEETARKWDIYVTWVGYESDEDVYWIGFDLSKISKITLYYDARKGETWAETE